MKVDMVVDMKVYMVADMEVYMVADKVADIEVDMVADMVADIDIDINIYIDINMEIQFVERVGHGGFRPEAYPACASSKLCEFIHSDFWEKGFAFFQNSNEPFRLRFQKITLFC